MVPITFFCNISIEFSVLILFLKPNCSSLIILNLLQKDKRLFENNLSTIFENCKFNKIDL